jgi:hypothetical protein
LIGPGCEDVTRELVAFLNRAQSNDCFAHVLKEFLLGLNDHTRWIMKLPGVFSDVIDFGRHLADKRHPVMGDKKYAGTGNDRSVEQPRQMLHAYRLVFNHPKTGKPVRATAPLPGDFKRCLAQFKLR